MAALHKNQKNAIEASLANNFASGIHFHATGTGKSWIALELVHQFHKANPKHCNILWICEQKSILLDQFDTRTLETKGYKHILKNYFVFDYSRNKPANWAAIVNTSAFWGKPLFIIINRAFLVSQSVYTNLKIPVHLIIHDECHSIVNKTSQEFYSHILTANPDARCIGFSATPVLQTPYKSILSKYTIYDACRDKVIVPPRIVWFKSDAKRISSAQLRAQCAQLFETQPYAKVIVWCGMIALCEAAAAEWSADPAFADWLIAIDTSKDCSGAAADYEAFYAAQGKALMFCAGKHREGSDIPYLDCCVFMDNVAERNHKTFVQCVGRVLRRDPAGRKTHGLIIDVNARSPIELCNRMNSYLQHSADVFPYRYSHYRAQNFHVNILDIVCDEPAYKQEPLTVYKNPAADLTAFWRRPCPDIPAYKDRLAYELTLFYEKDLMGYLFHALEILKMTSAIPHVTRGSCGSSLVCYLLGISNTDPVKYNIQFARFLNRFRNTMPDIDFDFPHNLRDEVFLQIYLKWPNRVARISNHVYYHEKSAFRKAIQLAGIRKRIPSLHIRDYVRRLPAPKRQEIAASTKRLENTFRTYSLHCGGIVFYPDGIPRELKLRETSVLSQVYLNKTQVSENKQFKIDILSSRALTQLFEAQGFPATIDFDAHCDDAATAALFARGDNIGITLAETPLMRRTLLALKPKGMDDIAKALAIIRPAAKKARYEPVTTDSIIYDDDAITVIQKYLGCDAEAADNIRRILTKTPKKELKAVLAKANIQISPRVLERLDDLRKYSFCKSHAYSYAQLVWQLGYMKAHHPAEFWRATLLHCQSSYRKWVHLYEAKLSGVQIDIDSKNLSIYAKHRRTRLEAMGLKERVKSLGIWAADNSFYPDCYARKLSDEAYEIRGLIASSRVLSYAKIKTVVLFIGYAPRKYIEVLVKGRYLAVQNCIGITCIAKLKKDSLESDSFTFW